MERLITIITDDGVRVETGQDADEVLREMLLTISKGVDFAKRESGSNAEQGQGVI